MFRQPSTSSLWMLWIVLVIAVGLLIACGDAPTVEERSVEQPVHQDGIAWYEGTVEEAFAHAEAQQQPLLLYWGAVWCPPCHYLKTKIFPRPEFIESSRKLVMVYLDGDTERAQIYGERFGTLGYPTVILFNSAGEEITRLPSTLPVDQYAAVLDAALGRLRSIEQIYADVQTAGVATADPIDLNLLAFYSWGQDRALELSPEERLESFRTFYTETPAELEAEKTRFLALYLMELAGQGKQAPELSDAERTDLREALLTLLGDHEKRRANLDLVFFSSRQMVGLLHSQKSEERNALVAAWNQAATALEADETLSLDDRLSALLPRVWLAQLDVEELGSETQDHVRQRIAWTIESVTDENEMQAVMSTMTGLLEEARLTGEAETLLSEHMDEAVAPYYFMSWLASMKAKSGEVEEALDLYRRSYETAEGRYTRFRQGSGYLLQLMKHQPEDVATIAADSERIFDELLSHEDAFAGSNHTRLKRLATAYKAWSTEEDRDAVLASLRQKVSRACEQYPAEADSQRERCQAFLAPSEDRAV